jgi:hypothetical protein
MGMLQNKLKATMQASLSFFITILLTIASNDRYWQ